MRLTALSGGSHQLASHLGKSLCKATQYKSSKTCIKRPTGYKSCCRRGLFKENAGLEINHHSPLKPAVVREKLTDMKKAPHFTKSNFQMLDPYYTSSPLHNEGQQQLGSLEAGTATAEQAQVSAEICLGSLPMQFETFVFFYE